MESESEPKTRSTNSESPLAAHRKKRLLSSSDDARPPAKLRKTKAHSQFPHARDDTINDLPPSLQPDNGTMSTLAGENDRLKSEVARLNAALDEARTTLEQATLDKKTRIATHDTEKKQLAQELFLENVMKATHHLESFERERMRMTRVQSAREHALTQKYNTTKLDLQHATSTLEAERKAWDVERRKTAKKHREVVLSYQSQCEVAVAELFDHKELLKTAYEDLKESLRLNHDTFMSFTKTHAAGLPPAYGSLDENPAAKAPWHPLDQDAGQARLAELIITSRRTFTKKHDAAQFKANERRYSANELDRLHAGAELFLDSTRALYDTCITLGEALQKIHDIPLETHRRFDRSLRNTSNATYSADMWSSSSRQKHVSKQKRPTEYDDESLPSRISHAAIVADRVACLIIDCSWEIIAAIDLRHYDVGRAITAHKSRILVYWQLIDTTLLQAIEIAVTGPRKHSSSPMIHDDPANILLLPGEHACGRCDSPPCASHCERMYEMCLYHTKLKSLHARLRDVSPHIDASMYLGETRDWLDESIETERVLSANAYLPPTRDPSEGPQARLRSVIASGSGTSDIPPDGRTQP